MCSQLNCRVQMKFAERGINNLHVQICSGMEANDCAFLGANRPWSEDYFAPELHYLDYLSRYLLVTGI